MALRVPSVHRRRGAGRGGSRLGRSLHSHHVRACHLQAEIAGLWDEWKDPETDKPRKSCTMIITEPNEFVAEVHDRMPVLLTEKQFDPWLSGEAGVGILKPAPNNFLQKWPVSKRVNSSRTDDNDPTLIDKVE